MTFAEVCPECAKRYGREGIDVDEPGKCRDCGKSCERYRLIMASRFVAPGERR